ncbi:hypothetical protein [Janthinobacterium sp. RB2R34]|uniref:hypothetical protein n=1 Tax=Janthinobacterium sp. RB2R34 TaxID=3424193 RepID=UPI003F210050
MAEIYLGKQMTSPALPAAAPMPGAARGWDGVYWSAATDEVVRLEWKEGTLRQVGGAALVPTGADVFRPDGLAHEWRFTAPPAGSSASPELRIRDFWPSSRVFSRVTEPAPDADALAGFAGRYRSDETDMHYTVRVAEGRARLSWARQYDVVLEAVGGNRFVSSLGTVTFTQDARGVVNGLTISNRRLRKFHVPRLGDGGEGSRQPEPPLQDFSLR